MTPEIRPVGPPSWQLPAAAAGQKSVPTPAVPDPVDGTVLGSTRQLPEKPEKPPPTKALAPEPEPASEPPQDLWPLKLRLAEREQAVPQIWAGQELERWAASKDPVSSHLARRRLADAFAGPETRLQEQVARYGPVEGPRLSLDWLSRASTFDAHRADQALQRLEQGLEHEPPTPQTLVTLMRVAHRTLQAGQPADKACQLLRRHGQGDGPLEEVLSQRLVPVHDGKLQLGPPPPDSPARQVALEVLEGMPALRPPKGADRLDPEVAAALVAEMTQGVPTDEQLASLGRLLEEASRRPILAALLAPHREALLQVAPHARGLGIVGGGVNKFLEGFGPTMGELTPAQTREQLGALLECTSEDARGWAPVAARGLIERHPAAADVILGRMEQRTPHDADWALLSHALDRGWKPDPLQRDLMLSWTVPPCDPDSDLTRYSFTAPALALARKLGDPGDLRLPSRQGQLVPYREALLSHALAGDLRAAKWPGTEDLVALLCPQPDPALERRLLQGLPEPFPAALSSCSPEQKSQLSLLSLLPLTPETRRLLDEKLAPCLPVDQLHLEPLLTEERGRQLSEAAAGLDPGELSDRLQAARRCVELTFQRGYRDQGSCFDFPELGQALAMVETLPPEQQKQVAAWLCNRLVEQTPLHELTPERMADFVLAVPLMGTDPTLEQRLKAMVVPRQSSTMPVYTAREHFLAHLEPLERSRLRQGMEDGPSRAAVDRLATVRQWESPEDLAAWAGGARGWAGEIVDRHGDRHQDAYAAFTELLDTGQPQAEWESLRGILNRLEAAGLMQQSSDPERFQQALTMWREVKAGGRLEEVLEAHGLAPAAGHGGVVETAGFVNVGGALLRRRTSR